MKACPYCNKKIEDNARFCLYCMSTLNEKKILSFSKKPFYKKRYIFVAAFSAVAILLSCIFAFPKNTVPSAATTDSSDIISSQQTSLSPDTASRNVASKNASSKPNLLSLIFSNSSSRYTSTSSKTNTATVTNKYNSSTPSKTSSSLKESSSSSKVSSALQSTSSTAYGESKTYKCFTYKIMDNGLINISKCDPLTQGEVIVPDKIEGRTVVGISYKAFADCTKITSVTIPDTVTAVGTGAFKNCTSLKTVNLSKAVNTIPDECFEGCVSLTYVNAGVIYLVKCEAFKDCKSLTTLNWYLNNNVYLSIGAHYFSYAFDGCTSLKEIYFPAALFIEVNNNAFLGCTNLKKIHCSASSTLKIDEKYANIPVEIY